MRITGAIWLCGPVAVASLIAMMIAIFKYKNIEAGAMFFISFVCFALHWMPTRYQWTGHESVDADLIANLGIAGGVCFLVGLFFLFYPKGKKDT